MEACVEACELWLEKQVNVVDEVIGSMSFQVDSANRTYVQLHYQNKET